MVPIRGFVLGGGLLAAGLFRAGSPPAPPVEFNRDIRPILGKCSACHGPASEEGSASLRLDTFAAATKKLPSGNYAIVPGKPDESELVKRVFATGDDVMPPASSHKVLSTEEKQLLRDWIEQGAEYKEHWAFVTPTRPAIPKIKMPGWARNDIDKFILANLEAHNLTPEKEAKKETLLRRLTLDITGLPPTPQELEDFLRDKSSNAYERVVDRLLLSPRYGERMAMDWMDYARYADSNGYQADFERFQSRWRDWVIDAFNRNMPYDQFTVEQIAGDLLPNATMEQKLATAFNRNHRINTEGGVIAEEWRVETVIDRVETTSAVWLGLTAGCARCHDHKYDPLTQKDFYRMAAYFNNVPESGTGEERPINHPPTIKAPTLDQSIELDALLKKVKDLQQSVGERVQASIRPSSTWVLPKPKSPDLTDGLVARYALSSKPKAVFGSVPEPKAVGEVIDDVGRSTGAVVTKDGALLDLGNVGDVDTGDQFSYGAWIFPTGGSGSPFAKMDSPNAYRGWDLFIIENRPMVHLISKWPENALKVISKTTLTLNEWSHIFVTYDGTAKPQGLKIYINGKPVETEVEVNALSGTIRNSVPLTIGTRTANGAFKGKVDDLMFFGRTLSAQEVAQISDVHPAKRLLTIPVKSRTKEQVSLIAREWLAEKDADFRESVFDLAKTEQSIRDLKSEIPDVMVMEEMPKPREAFVLIRGQYDKRGEKVEAGLPSFLPPMRETLPNNRLGFARWVVSAENPMTSRVTVNRLWARFFGNGLVETIEDFGTRAEFPSNPALLDYLATEFVRLKWDQKALIKQIVMSASYRQSSFVSEAKLLADPHNRLVSRGPRFRLAGEVIRDQALFASGLLFEKLGGPSVRPVQPKGIWDETNFYGNLRNYTPDLGPGLYRRSLYTIWKRTAAPPNMLLFDVPSRETCRVQRARTDTPLQALTLMNDETFVEAARVMAQRMLKEGGVTVESRLAYGFRLLLARDPSQNETDVMRTALTKRLERYENDLPAARALISVGYARVDRTLNPAELAAYTIAASTLLNLDEAVNKE